MFLKLTPIKLKLKVLVTLEVNLLFTTITKTLFKATLWQYKAPTITKKMVDVTIEEKDDSPPIAKPVVVKPGVRNFLFL